MTCTRLVFFFLNACKRIERHTDYSSPPSSCSSVACRCRSHTSSVGRRRTCVTRGLFFRFSVSAREFVTPFDEWRRENNARRQTIRDRRGCRSARGQKKKGKKRKKEKNHSTRETVVPERRTGVLEIALSCSTITGGFIDLSSIHTYVYCV